MLQGCSKRFGVQLKPPDQAHDTSIRICASATHAFDAVTGPPLIC
jgi:hypothetical protein